MINFVMEIYLMVSMVFVVIVIIKLLICWFLGLIFYFGSLYVLVFIIIIVICDITICSKIFVKFYVDIKLMVNLI